MLIAVAIPLDLHADLAEKRALHRQVPNRTGRFHFCSDRPLIPVRPVLHDSRVVQSRWLAPERS
jgi:hypothetical protein